MRNVNGQSIPLHNNLGNTADDTRHVSKTLTPLLPAQAEFIDYIMFHGVSEFSESLKLIHDLALYHTDVPFDQNEKAALFNLKILWEGFEQIEKEC